MYAHCSLLFSYPFTYHPLFFNSFQYTSLYLSSIFISYVMWCYWYSIILFSFPFFPKFHTVVPLLQTCSTSEFVYDHACFVYMFFFGSIFHLWEKTCSLCVSVPGLLHLTWCPPIASIYIQTTCHYPYGEVIFCCVYIPQFLDPFISCRIPGLFPKFCYYE
jgi:hypothetical protein